MHAQGCSRGFRDAGRRRCGPGPGAHLIASPDAAPARGHGDLRAWPALAGMVGTRGQVPELAARCPDSPAGRPLTDSGNCAGGAARANLKVSAGQTTADAGRRRESLEQPMSMHEGRLLSSNRSDQTSTRESFSANLGIATVDTSGGAPEARSYDSGGKLRSLADGWELVEVVGVEPTSERTRPESVLPCISFHLNLAVRGCGGRRLARRPALQT